MQHIHTWQHKNAASQIIGEIERFIDEKGRKQDIPFYIPNERGNFDKGTTETMKAEGNPLFGIETIADKNKPVIVCEGQKSAVAWSGLGYQCITSILGANNAHNSNWGELEGVQEILFAPDNDTAGENYIKNIAEILSIFGKLPLIKIVRLPNLPPKGDICDWLKQQPELVTWNELDSLENHPAKNIIRDRLDKIIAENTQAVSDEWLGWEEPEEIANSTLLPVKPLQPAIIPEPYREFITDVAHRMQCSLDFVAIASIVSTSAIVGAGCSIRPKQFDNWTITPNLWGVAIADPSQLKTPSLKAFLDLLVCLEKEAKKDFEKVKSQDEANMLVHKHKLKNAENAISEAVKNGAELEIENAKRKYELLKSEEPKKNVRRRFKTNDSTIEKMGELLSENPRGILLVRDELIGLLRSWDKTGHESDRAFYLEAWDGGGSFTTDRIGRGTIDIETACVSILGTIQPDKLTDYLFQARNGDNDGFVQRLQLAVFPDKVEWQLVDRPPKTEAKQRVFAVLKNLKDMDFVKYGAVLGNKNEIPYFHFCKSAQIVSNNWLTDIQKKIEEEPLPIMQEHLTKYRKLMPSLALLFHLIDIASGKNFDESSVNRKATEKAVAWCDYIESHARRIYGICTTLDRQAISALAGKIKANKLQSPFTVRDVYRKQWHMLTDKNLVKAACEELVEANWLHKNITPPAFGQKPKTLYFISPKVKINMKNS